MATEAAEDELLKGEALILANFGLSTQGMSPDTYARLLAQAMWIESWRLRNQAQMIAQLFGANEKSR